jgi:hypothetical protein
MSLEELGAAVASALGVAVPDPFDDPYAGRDCPIPDGTRDDALCVAVEPARFFEFYMRRFWDKGYEPVAAERMVYDHGMRTTGTIDAIFRQRETGRVLLVDWKRRPEYTAPKFFSDRGFFDSPARDLRSCHETMALIQLNCYRGMLARAGPWFVPSTATTTTTTDPIALVPDELEIVSVYPGKPVESHPVPIDEALFASIAAHREAAVEAELSKISSEAADASRRTAVSDPI